MLYLYALGGLYVDADVSACSVDGLRLNRTLAPYALVLVRSPKGWLSNFFMASVRGHPFWEFALRRLPTASRRRDGTSMGSYVLRSTGPLFLNATLHAFHAQRPGLEAEIGPTKVFSAAQWQRATGASHHWASTWLSRQRHERGRVHMKQPVDACGETHGTAAERWAGPTDL